MWASVRLTQEGLAFLSANCGQRSRARLLGDENNGVHQLRDRHPNRTANASPTASLRSRWSGLIRSAPTAPTRNRTPKSALRRSIFRARMLATSPPAADHHLQIDGTDPHPPAEPAGERRCWPVCVPFTCPSLCATTGFNPDIDHHRQRLVTIPAIPALVSDHGDTSFHDVDLDRHRCPSPSIADMSHSAVTATAASASTVNVDGDEHRRRH